MIYCLEDSVNRLDVLLRNPASTDKRYCEKVKLETQEIVFYSIGAKMLFGRFWETIEDRVRYVLIQAPRVIPQDSIFYENIRKRCIDGLVDLFGEQDNSLQIV